MYIIDAKGSNVEYSTKKEFAKACGISTRILKALLDEKFDMQEIYDACVNGENIKMVFARHHKSVPSKYKGHIDWKSTDNKVCVDSIKGINIYMGDIVKYKGRNCILYDLDVDAKYVYLIAPSTSTITAKELRTQGAGSRTVAECMHSEYGNIFDCMVFDWDFKRHTTIYYQVSECTDGQIKFKEISEDTTGRYLQYESMSYRTFVKLYNTSKIEVVEHKDSNKYTIFDMHNLIINNPDEF